MSAPRRIATAAMALLLVGGPAWGGASGDGSSERDPSSQENGIGKEIEDLGRAIRESMEEKGEYVRDSLGQWSKEGSTWAADRALQLRVKTALAGVLGMGSVASINVDVEAGVVTLKGELETWEQVARAVQTTQQIESVRRVVSRLKAPKAANHPGWQSGELVVFLSGQPIYGEKGQSPGS